LLPLQIPLKFPKEYLDLHPLDGVEAPPEAALPDLLPHVAYDPWTDVQERDDVKAVRALHNVSFPFGALPTLFARRIRQSYFASVSYVDAQFGRLLDVLDQTGAADNTIIALWGDHGAVNLSPPFPPHPPIIPLVAPPRSTSTSARSYSVAINVLPPCCF
jgi:hypothetical protein